MSRLAQPADAVARPEPNVPVARALIDGSWVEGADEIKQIANPHDGRIVARVRFSSHEQIEQAVSAARRAQPAWAARPLAERADLMAAAIDALEPRGEQISRWIAREMGKTIREARDEIYAGLLVGARALVEDARRFGGSTPPPASAQHKGRRVYVIHQPIGVAAFISPWNFPTLMVCNCIAAMTVGNACVWKPSEWSPYAPQLVCEALVEAGVPAGVLNLVYGGPESGEHLVTREAVGFVGFIGSTPVGERIAARAGVKRLVLELGGNGPMIVLDDADLDAAVDAAAASCFYQAGQVCTAAERLLVHEAVHDEFAQRLAARARQVRGGDPLDEQTEMGPLSDVRILDKVVRHVEGARAGGAEILAGGRHDGLYFEPTVLTNVKPGMEIADEETFGPVAPIIKVASAEEALRIANDSPYALSMSVFTSSLKTAFELAEGLDGGTVAVNAGTSEWELSGPFGGNKKSGLGRESGPEGIRAFTNAKTITFNLA